MTYHWALITQKWTIHINFAQEFPNGILNFVSLWQKKSGCIWYNVEILRKECEGDKYILREGVWDTNEFIHAHRILPSSFKYGIVINLLCYIIQSDNFIAHFITLPYALEC